jgi:hypothetical protein
MIPEDAIRRARDNDIGTTATHLGAVLRKATTTERVGPCPVCGGTDRFSINTKKQTWHCRGCAKGGGVIDLVQHVHGSRFPEAVAWLNGESHCPPRAIIPAPVRAKPAADHTDNSEKAFALWREGVDPRGTSAERYLNSRALELDVDIASEVLRWHPPTGALMALFRNVLTGEAQAISRIFLDREGKKLGRKFLGPVAGAAIMLDPFEDGLEGLHVGEGVETCLAARQLRLRPCWALGSAPAVAAFPVLSGIECLTLLQENDEPSERAVEACAARWHAAGRDVFINTPTVGKDLNDAIIRRSSHDRR